MTVRKPSRSEARQQRKQAKEKTLYRPPLIARNARQAEYLEALATRKQVFCIGPEGTAKTYLAARYGIRQVIEGTKHRLILARPTVSKPKHRLGYRPGDQDEKVEDWLIPILDAVRDECGMATIERMKLAGDISYAAFETMMGRTFTNAVIILDEAQNCDFSDLRLFVTRQGENTQCLVNGSLEQIGAIPDSGLAQIVDMIERYGLDVALIKFTDEDVTRSAITAQWVRAFRQEALRQDSIRLGPSNEEDDHTGLMQMLSNSRPPERNLAMV